MQENPTSPDPAEAKKMAETPVETPEVKEVSVTETTTFETDSE